MKTQVWYFKFDFCILGPVIQQAKFDGRFYNPETLPDYVYKALGMTGHKSGGRARMYPESTKLVADALLCQNFPLHWRWNRINITLEN